MGDKTNVSLSFKSKPQSNRLQKPTASFTNAAATADSSSRNYVTEFVPAEAPLPPEPQVRPIAPTPDEWRPNNLHQPATDISSQDRGENSILVLRKFREDLDKLPNGTSMDEFTDVPVEGFGAALLSGYGWEEGRGIGRNAREDVKVPEVAKKTGRGGLGFTEELPASRV